MEQLSEQQLSTQLIEQDDDNQMPQSHILLKGENTQVSVEGAMLEASLKIGDRYLVLMTDDIPNEDMLHVHLLDSELNLLDSVTIGAPYSTGSLRDLQQSEPNSIIFHFIGDTPWRVTVNTEKQRHIPLLSDPKGVSRKLGFSCYLKVEGSPQPES